MFFNWKVLINILGLILVFTAGFMLLCLPVSLYYGSQDWQALLWSAGITLLVGGGTWLITRDQQDKEMRRRDGYLVVTLSWVLISYFGSMHNLFSGAIQEYQDAYFEAM